MADNLIEWAATRHYFFMRGVASDRCTAIVQAAIDRPRGFMDERYSNKAYIQLRLKKGIQSLLLYGIV